MRKLSPAVALLGTLILVALVGLSAADEDATCKDTAGEVAAAKDDTTADDSSETEASETDSSETEASGADLDENNPIWANAACYVCHISFVKEELGKVHLKAKVTCMKCHGLSAPHANDEHIGATRPDVTFNRKQIDPMCEACHKAHDVPARDIVALVFQRSLSPKSPIVCTDCHGTHKIERSKEDELDEHASQ